MTTRTGPRRDGLPRAKSTSNMNMIDPSLSREAFRDMARDAVNKSDNLRALAEFFRTTTIPPSETRNSSSADETTAFCGADGVKLWYGQSSRRAKRSRSQPFHPATTATTAAAAAAATTTKAQRPNRVTLETTADGNPYALISLPISIEGSGPWWEAPETIFKAPTPITTVNPDGNRWSERTSSRGGGGGLSPSTPLPTNIRAPFPRSSVGVAAAWKTPKSSSKPEWHQQQHHHPLETTTTFAIKHDGSEPLGLASASEPSSSAAATAAVQTAQALLPAPEVPGFAVPIPVSDPTNSSFPCSSSSSPSPPPPPAHPTPHSNGIKECRNSDGSSPSLNVTPQWPMPSPTCALPATPSRHTRKPMSKPFNGSGAGSPAAAAASAAPQVSSSSSPSSTSNSMGNSPKTLANMTVQVGLQAPRSNNCFPDSQSPGFATMLASTTFPSPPLSSRPSTGRSNSSGTITIIASTPSPPRSPPTIRPCTSSNKYSKSSASDTSNKQLSLTAVSAVLLPTASLNKIVMRSDCTDGRLQHAPASGLIAQSEQHNVVDADQGQSQMPLTTTTSTTQINSLIATPAGQLAHPNSMDTDTCDRRESVASFATARERPDSVDSIDKVAAADGLQRVSNVTDLTINTTNSYQQSLAMSRPSQQSARSDITTTTIDSTNTYDSSRYIASSRTSLDVDDFSSDEAKLNLAKVPSQIQQVNSTQGAAAAVQGSSPVRHAAADVPRPGSRNAVGESNVQQSLLERRIARKAARKVWALNTNSSVENARLAQASSGDQAFKRRISKSVDSPVLDSLPGENGNGGGGGGGTWRSRPPRLSVSEPSPLANETHTYLLSPPTESDEKAYSTYSTSPAPSTQGEYSPAFSISSRPSRPLRHQLSMSSTMVVETVPDDIPESPVSTVSSDHLTISAIMIVVNLEPGPITPPKRRPLSFMFLEKANMDLNNLSPHSKVKSKSRQRPLSVRIARNSVTGLLERTESHAVPVDQTMSRMPTPPETPEPFQNRRVSLMRPLPIRLPTPEPTALSRHSDADDLSSSEEEDERPDPTQRIASIKERLRKEKLQKEKEIADMIARTVVTAPKTCEGKDDGSPRDDDEPTNAPDDDKAVDVSRDVDRTTTPELEQRIEKLSQKGDAWRGVMGPLMENMSRMLSEMQGDGMCVGLTMSEFTIDLEAEAKRISIYGQTSTPVEATPVEATPNTTNADDTFDGFDGTQPAAEEIASVKPAASDENQNPRKGRSEANMAKLRLDLDGSGKKDQESQASEDAEQNAKSDLQNPAAAAASGVSLPTTPRTPGQLEMDALMSITRRMQAQEALMDQLMSRWGTPSTRYKSRNDSSTSGWDSSRPSMSFSERKSSTDSSTSGMGAALEELKQRAFPPQEASIDLTAPAPHDGTTTSLPAAAEKAPRDNNQSGMDVVDSLMGELRSSSKMSIRYSEEKMQQQ